MYSLRFLYIVAIASTKEFETITILCVLQPKYIYIYFCIYISGFFKKLQAIDHK